MKRCLMIVAPVHKNTLLYYCAILIMAVIIMPCIGNTETKKHISTLIQIEILEQSLSKFKADVGRFPTSEEGLSALIKMPPNIKSWKGAYFNKPLIPKDYWGSKFIYIFPARYGNKVYDLYSMGKNMKDDNGNGDDISNWNKINMSFYQNPLKNFLPSLVLMTVFAVCIAIFLHLRKKRKWT